MKSKGISESKKLVPTTVLKSSVSLVSMGRKEGEVSREGEERETEREGRGGERERERRERVSERNRGI